MEKEWRQIFEIVIIHKPIQNLGLIGSAVLTFTGHKGLQSFFQFYRFLSYFLIFCSLFLFPVLYIPLLFSGFQGLFPVLYIPLLFSDFLVLYSFFQFYRFLSYSLIFWFSIPFSNFIDSSLILWFSGFLFFFPILQIPLLFSGFLGLFPSFIDSSIFCDPT